jgi:hypothetical protein
MPKDPAVRSSLALELQPKTVELEKGEFFKDVKYKSKTQTLKMTMAGMLILDPLSNVSDG